MSNTGPWFHAWCDAAQRVDALAATLSAFVLPDGTCHIGIHPLGNSETEKDKLSIDEAIATVRAVFGTGIMIIVGLPTMLSSGRLLWISLYCHDPPFEDRYPSAEPLGASKGDVRDVLVERMEVAIGSGVRSTPVEATIISIQVQQEMEDFLRGLCAPDRRSRVTTGAYELLGSWGAPVEMAATYHRDMNAARDLALSWVHLHDGDRMTRAAGLSLDALQARVEAAPPGARVGVTASAVRLEEHLRGDRAAERSHDKRPKRKDAVRNGPRSRLPGDADLTREQVLAALSTPPATLLEALEAAAVPDDEWRAAEPLALELIEATKKGAPTYEVNVSTGKHVRWIEQHAPYHVRRLPNGGVMLATHPYRILWPLWADALSLLGIREST